MSRYHVKSCGTAQWRRHAHNMLVVRAKHCRAWQIVRRASRSVMSVAAGSHGVTETGAERCKCFKLNIATEAALSYMQCSTSTLAQYKLITSMYESNRA